MALITNGMILHLDANNDSSVIRGADNFVNQWMDLSGSGNNATSTGNNRPLYTSNALNGKSVLRFDGTDFLTMTNIVGNHDVFIVIKMNDKTATFNGIFTHDSKTYTTINLGLDRFELNRFAYTTKQILLDPHILNVNEFVDTTSGIPANAIMVDGVGVATAMRTNGVTVANTIIGTLGSHGANCDIAEIIMYNRALDIEERLQNTNYLGSKWLSWASETTPTMKVGISDFNLDIIGGFVGVLGANKVLKQVQLGYNGVNKVVWTKEV